MRTNVDDRETGQGRLFRGTLAASLLAGMALCPRLWAGARAFPAVPALNGLPDLPTPLGLALLALLVGGVVATAALPRPELAARIVVASGATLALFDVDRLQPWFYQALILFLVLGARREDAPRRTAALVEFVLAATYVWSGLQKANPAFGARVLPWLLHPLGLDASPALDVAVPLFETAVGLLLLAPRGRPWGLAGVVGIHGLLLVALGPLGRSCNSVVWPWNVGMPALGLVAFLRNPEPTLRAAWATPFGKGVVLLVGALPALNSVGLWDDDLSDALYTGRSRQGFVLLTERGAAAIPPAVRPYLQRRPDRIGLDLDRWALGALNVPPYPEPRVFRGVARWLLAAGVADDDLTLVVGDRPVGGEKPRFRIVPVR